MAEANAKAAEKAAKEREASILKLEEQALWGAYTTQHVGRDALELCIYACACNSLLTAAGPGPRRPSGGSLRPTCSRRRRGTSERALLRRAARLRGWRITRWALGWMCCC